jgi:hypothetical protein
VPLESGLQFNQFSRLSDNPLRLQIWFAGAAEYIVEQIVNGNRHALVGQSDDPVPGSMEKYPANGAGGVEHQGLPFAIASSDQKGTRRL